MTAPTDRDLIIRARRGAVGGGAFGDLVTRYQTSVFNVCYRMLHERCAAEDLAQETFMRAYDRLHTFDLEREFGPWIRRVAANLCLNHLESQKATAPLDEERDAEGKVHGKWPGLGEGQLIGPGDLAVTTDYRDVLSEVLVKRLHNPAKDMIFPNYESNLLGLMK